MADIIICEFMDEAVIAEQFAGQSVLYDATLVDRPQDLIAALTDARAVIVRNRTQIRGDLLAQATKLQVVGRLGVGLDNIDVPACKARGIAVCPASGANDLSVAEYVVLTALQLLRNATHASAQVATGSWPRMALIGREMSGRRLGLIGFGAIAKATAKRAQALGMSIAAYDPYLPAGHQDWTGILNQTLPELLQSADVVSLHIPLTQETRHLIDSNALALMKPDAVLINAARGGIVDEEALAQALKQGQLAGAALDVFEEEPLSAKMGAKFLGLPNLILTPHIAGVTDESNVRVSQVTAENVLKHLR
jgi:(S)-sulfolactate dehydrogenase